MNRTPQRLKKIWDKETKPTCARKSVECRGRMTKEHVFLYGGKQIQEAWSVINLCWHHHLGKGFNKSINECIALKSATIADFKKYPKKPWLQMKAWCNKT